MKDSVTAPAPEVGPVPPPGAPPPDAQRDLVKTASMTVTVSNTSEAADKAAVLVEDADGRVDSRSEDAGSNRGWLAPPSCCGCLSRNSTVCCAS